jgi:L-asparaginase
MGEGQALHKSTWMLAAAMLLAGTTLHAQPVEPAATSQVRILATGGTIAGKGNAAGTSYRSGAVSVDDLIAALPGVEKTARVTGEQIANVPSSDMDETIWRKLHARALAAFADPDVAGVVVTHGTDTLEETAFLLSLILPPTKPVVVVGAMRPSTETRDLAVAGRTIAVVMPRCCACLGVTGRISAPAGPHRAADSKRNAGMNRVRTRA